MARGIDVRITKQSRPGRKPWRADWREFGKRKRREFPTKREAEEFAAQWLADARSAGPDRQLTERERNAVFEFRAALKRAGLTVREALAEAVARNKALEESCTVAELVEDLLARKEREGRAVRYLSDLRSRLGFFSRKYGDWPVAGVTAEVISDFLGGL